MSTDNKVATDSPLDISDLLPAYPDQIEVTEESPTSEELEQYLKAWREDAEEGGKIYKLLYIVSVLGKFTKCESFMLGSPLRYRVGDVTIYKFNGLLCVYLGGEEGREAYDYANHKSVVGWYQRGIVHRSSNTYIPGEWESILSYYDLAKKTHEAMESGKVNKIRTDLLNKIGISGAVKK